MTSTTRIVLVGALLSFGCGGTAAPSKSPDRAAVQIASAPEAESGAVSDVVTPPPSPPAADLEQCIEQVRSSVAASGADYELYKGALAAERSGDDTAARRQFLKLISEHPQSPLVPFTYFAFGELFFVDAARDASKWDFVDQADGKVLSYPPPNNQVYAVAMLRVAQAKLKKGEPSDALYRFKETLHAVSLHRDLPCNAQVERAATDGAIEAFVAVGAPFKAPFFFKEALGPDKAKRAIAATISKYVEAGQRGSACMLVKALDSEWKHPEIDRAVEAANCKK